MAEKHLTESAWKAYAKGRGYKDTSLIKALADQNTELKPDPTQADRIQNGQNQHHQQLAAQELTQDLA